VVLRSELVLLALRPVGNGGIVIRDYDGAFIYDYDEGAI
jgi:hypothetical protein